MPTASRNASRNRASAGSEYGSLNGSDSPYPARSTLTTRYPLVGEQLVLLDPVLEAAADAMHQHDRGALPFVAVADLSAAHRRWSG